MLCKVVLTFKSVDETLECDHSNGSYWAVLSFSTNYALSGGFDFKFVKEILKNDHLNESYWAAPSCMLYKVVLTFKWLKNWCVTIQMKAIELYFRVERAKYCTLYFCGPETTRASTHGNRISWPVKKVTVHFARQPTCARCQFSFSFPKHIFVKFFVACPHLVFFVFFFFLLLFIHSYYNNKALITSNAVEFHQLVKSRIICSKST